MQKKVYRYILLANDRGFVKHTPKQETSKNKACNMQRHSSFTSVDSTWETQSWVHQPKEPRQHLVVDSSPATSVQWAYMAKCNARKTSPNKSTRGRAITCDNRFMDSWMHETCKILIIAFMQGVILDDNILSKRNLQSSQSN